MPYLELTFSQLLQELNDIKVANTALLNEIATQIEELFAITGGTSVEWIVRELDSFRSFFRQAELFLEEIPGELPQENITFGLIERMSNFGEGALNLSMQLTQNIQNKEDFYVIEGASDLFNSCYANIGDNLQSMNRLEDIAFALNRNFRFVVPFDDLTNEQIALQSGDGITVTNEDEMYINEVPLPLGGQKKQIMLLLINRYINNQGVSSWMEIEEEIRVDNNILEKDSIVNRVSDLRTELGKLGFSKDELEIQSVGRGVDSSWKLVKH